MPNKKLLAEIVTKKPNENIFVFDLDSTLFDVSYRTQAILKHFIANEEFKNKHPQIGLLNKVVVEPGDWGLKTAVQRSIVDLPIALLKDLKDYWQKHFFSNEFLYHDVPYTDAHRFLNHLEKNGHAIHYLTGRDRKNMGPGTIESLKQHNFPLAHPSHLIMKAEKGTIEDEDFKVIELKKLLELCKNSIDENRQQKMTSQKIIQQNSTSAKKIIFFENEPVIIHKVLEQLPEVEIIWLDTTHSGKALPPTHVTKMVGHYGF
jgi:hypothetical protein